MIICSNCFRDSEIVSIINRTTRIGDCPICGAHKVKLYNSSAESTLNGFFDNLLAVYTPIKDLPSDYPKEDTDTLGRILAKDWEIFSDIGENEIINIVRELSPTVVEDIPELFTSPVGILEKYNIEYLKEHSILRTQKWDDFVEVIKHKNRFHTNLINTKLLEQYCLHINKAIDDPNQRFYRGRISRTPRGFKKKEMGAPPANLATDGRANSAGISRLYLTYDKETTLHEIRAAEFDFISIATFKATEPIRVVDLKQIAAISPFAPDVDCTSLAINREHLQKINYEMGRTMRRNDSPLDYLPTQYICDFIMSIEDENGNPVFDGIEYQSAMRASGANIAVFYPEKFKCTYCSTYEVTELTYHRKSIK